MGIYKDFRKIFHPCEHKNKTFLGSQETQDPDVFLLLYNCDDCNSTISESSKNKLQGHWETK